MVTATNLTKLQAFLIHFAISATVVAMVFAVIWFIWYPSPLFELFGAWEIIRVLIVVDLVLGPLLTLIVYRAGKARLLFDMVVIAAIQVSALVYGVASIYTERPCYMVFSVDRFEALSCDMIDPAQLAARSDLNQRRWYEPLYVVALMPTDPAERNRLLQEVMFEGKPDLPLRVAYWANFEGDALDGIRGKSVPLAQATMDTSLMEKAVAAAGPDGRLLPMPARDDFVTLVIDPQTFKPVARLPVDFWEVTAR